MHKLIPSAILALILIGCNETSELVQRTDYGRAQGSTYAISYITGKDVKHQSGIDSILQVIDKSMSTYQSNSTISLINRGDTVPVDDHFWNVWLRSVDIWKETGGLFDVTVYPLISLWNFERKEQRIPDSLAVDSVLRYVGTDLVENVTQENFWIPENVKLDFNAIAQGYTVDVICDYLEMNGIEHYLVEVGGELRTKGKNIDEQIWRIGIEKPEEEKQYESFQKVIALENAGLATSGSYRKFIEDTTTGDRYSHAVNPLTGYATNDPLMSVTVIANTTMDADAYATALLVMGLDAATEFMNQRGDLAIYLIYFDKFKGWVELSNDAFQALDSK